ncbi:hypothetical protein ACNOYE_03780 [Nannocystaceae bacterium ST9]
MSTETPALVSSPIQPSEGLWAAAVLGLLALAPGCDRGPQAEPDPLACDEDSSSSGVADEVSSSDDGSTSGDTDGESSSEGESSESDTGSTSETGGDEGPIVTEEIEGTRTFASLEQECDERGGYVQIHASCSGVNACAGFSYGDWDPGLLTEHTCKGVNGCNGLSCVILPPDGGLTGKQVYEADLPETSSRSCKNCHAAWTDEGVDMTKFKLWLAPGSTRTIDDWLDLPAEAQARIVAFGKTTQMPDGMVLANMAPYHEIWSRAEIERAVEYIRTQTQVEIHMIKVAD